MDGKTKELVAFGIAVASRHGAASNEIMETMGVAISMGGGPAVTDAAQTVEANDQFAATAQPAAS